MINLYDHELAFAIEVHGEDFRVGIDKVGGGTIGSHYSCEDWCYTVYNNDDEKVSEGEFYMGGSVDHFKAASNLFGMINDETIQVDNVKERVSKGVVLLDNTVPEWRKLIDTTTLDICDAQYCILGQVFYNYSTGLDVMQGMDSGFDAKEYGFDSYWGDSERLKGEWTSRILSNS